MAEQVQKCTFIACYVLRILYIRLVLRFGSSELKIKFRYVIRGKNWCIFVIWHVLEDTTIISHSFFGGHPCQEGWFGLTLDTIYESCTILLLEVYAFTWGMFQKNWYVPKGWKLRLKKSERSKSENFGKRKKNCYISFLIDSTLL